MTYDTVEKSAWSGKPIELYDFFRSYVHWRYTSSQIDVTFNYADYLAVPIKRTEIDLTNELNRASLKITVPPDNEIADMWRVSPPSEPIQLILSQYHEGDTDLAVMWVGRVITVEWSGGAATIIVEPTYTSVKRPGLRRRYQRACPHVLYGPACRLTDQTFRLQSTVASILNLDVNVSNAGVNGNTYYAGGYLQWEIELGIYERRYIVSHTGSTVVLATSPHSLSVGQAVELYPGCNHTLDACNTKFGNAANYGGMPFIPVKNPFGGDPIY